VEYTFTDISVDGTITGPGDAVTISFMVNNVSGVDDWEYPTVYLVGADSWLSLSFDEMTYFGILAGDSTEVSVDATSTGEAMSGMSTEINLEMSRLHCDTEESTVSCPTFEPASVTITVE
jgi:hypothetical protein